MIHRIAVTSIVLGALLGSSQIAQGQPDPCADSYLASQYSQCTSEPAIAGRRARGIAEPAHPEDPLVIRAHRREGATARPGGGPQPARQARSVPASSKVAQAE